MNVLIFISWPVKAWCISDANVALLRERFPDIRFDHARDQAEAATMVGEADAAFTPFLKPEWATPEAAPRLAWVHSSASAVEGLLPLSDLERHGVTITNSRGVQAVPMAERVMGGLLV